MPKQHSRDAKIAFKPSEAEDVVAYRVRVRPANTPAVKDEPYDEVELDEIDNSGTDGKLRIAFSQLEEVGDLDGKYDVHVTAVDDSDQESGFLEIDNQDFDFVPPDTPTDGGIES